MSDWRHSLRHQQCGAGVRGEDLRQRGVPGHDGTFWIAHQRNSVVSASSEVLLQANIYTHEFHFNITFYI